LAPPVWRDNAPVSTHEGADMSIREILTHDHRHCDDLFAEAEQMAATGKTADTTRLFDAFQAGMQAHFAGEEQTLFPAFEMKTGSSMGPTQVMRLEHDQMRGLMKAAADALAADDANEFLCLTETLLIMMQQHNMKEENVLYPMCEQYLANQVDALGEQLSGVLCSA
jgi:iron-sulfur cluster repair protein YtfE (RIC family)